MLWILRYEALGVQSRQNRVALASPRFLILRVGRSGHRHQQRKVGCSPRCFRGRPAVHLDVLVSAVAGVAVLRFELRRLGQSVGDGREGILPQSRIDVLLPDVLGDRSARRCRSTALEWYLVRHEIRGGGRNQNPNEAVSPNIRKRLLRVICHYRPSVHQGGAERSPPDARPNASPGRSPCDATRPRTRSSESSQEVGPARGSRFTREAFQPSRIIARHACMCNISHAIAIPPLEGQRAPRSTEKRARILIAGGHWGDVMSGPRRKPMARRL